MCSMLFFFQNLSYKQNHTIYLAKLINRKTSAAFAKFLQSIFTSLLQNQGYWPDHVQILNQFFLVIVLMLPQNFIPIWTILLELCCKLHLLRILFAGDYTNDLIDFYGNVT